MHPSSYQKMDVFFREVLEPNFRNESIRILDLGSCDVNGTYRTLVGNPNWSYTGADLEAGKNVDVVIADPHNWKELPSDSFDAVISGQVFEHVEYVWEVIREVARVLKPGGVCCIIAPATGPEHRYPRDCWRIFQDGFVCLARWASLEVLYCRTDWTHAELFSDSVLIACKPPFGLGDEPMLCASLESAYGISPESSQRYLQDAREAIRKPDHPPVQSSGWSLKKLFKRN